MLSRVSPAINMLHKYIFLLVGESFTDSCKVNP